MAILQLLFKDAKEYEKKGIVRIIKPCSPKKKDDIVLVTTEGILMCRRRIGKTAELKELINKSLDKPNKILYK